MQCKVTIHRTTPGSLKTRRFLKFSDVRVNSKRQLELLKEKKKKAVSSSHAAGSVAEQGFDEQTCGDRSRAVTSCPTLSCRQPRGTGEAGGRDLLLSLPPCQHFRASQPARRLQTRSPYQSGLLTSLRQFSKPSRSSLRFREKTANNSLSSEKENVSVMRAKQERQSTSRCQ